MVIPLSNIEPGQRAKIVYLANEELMAGRLFDLGFTPGAVVECVLQRPKKNIAAYLVRHAVIALRKTDSRLIFAQEIRGTGSKAEYTKAENAGSSESVPSSHRGTGK